MIVEIRGIQLDLIGEDPQYQSIAREIAGEYDFDSIDLRPGDVVIDVGAHVGIVSMFLAKIQSRLVIHAYEPMPEIFDLLSQHLELNKIANVTPHKLAVTADGRTVKLQRGAHSAEATAFFEQPISGPGQVTQSRHKARSITLPRIFKRYNIKRCRLLKLDCEGAEHEILAHADGLLDRVDYIRGEIHQIPTLMQQGYSASGTMGRFPSERSKWMVI